MHNDCLHTGPLFNDYNTVGWTTTHASVHKAIVFHHSHVMVREQRYHHVHMNAVLSALAVRVPLKEAAVVEFARLVEEAGGESACQRGFVPTNEQTEGEETAQGNVVEAMQTRRSRSHMDVELQLSNSVSGERLSSGASLADIAAGTRAPTNTPNRTTDSPRSPANKQQHNGHQAREAPTRTPLTVQRLVDLLQEEVTRNSNTALLVETGDAWFIGHKLRLTGNTWYYMQMQYGSIGWALGESNCTSCLMQQ